MTKIAFFDVDGTMINVPHQLLKPTDKTIHALKELQKQGNYIVVASARGVKPECLDEIRFDGFHHGTLYGNIRESFCGRVPYRQYV